MITCVSGLAGYLVNSPSARNLSANQPLRQVFTDSEESDYLEVTIPEAGVTLRAYNINGYYTFDYTNIIRALFEDSIREYYVTAQEDEVNREFDTNKAFSIVATLPSNRQGGSTISTAQYTFYNNVVDRWESLNSGYDSGRLLTLQGNKGGNVHSLRKWVNYPLEVAFISNLFIDLTNSLSFQIGASGTIFTSLEDGLDAIGIGGTTAQPQSTYNVETLAAPDNAMYVRWANAFGGYDYYMFTAKGEAYDIKAANTIDIGRRSIYDDGKVPYDKTYTRKMVVHSEYEHDNDWKALQFLPRSRKVSYWDVKNVRWIDIEVSDTKYDVKGNACGGSLEVTFEMPTQMGLAYV